eukprot:Protomagalhaensia_sp_Gyna_25__3035@NODE_279_length_4065_cov_305_284401_g214_i0_p5_GENE_NODE_279_length_4065_cov_305_284401_g214_i0NODE_279_length_4065_cov_305_284401_g214_i0_p5_ORF_typecomplete_len115_score6_59_NODE_279_length_4065_cov_305_284401_g214_i036053949
MCTEDSGAIKYKSVSLYQAISNISSATLFLQKWIRILLKPEPVVQQNFETLHQGGFVFGNFWCCQLIQQGLAIVMTDLDAYPTLDPANLPFLIPSNVMTSGTTFAKLALPMPQK